MQHSTGFIDLINHLKETVTECDVHHVKDLLDNNNTKTVIIDVRETEEWDNGYIPRAIHLSKGILERDIEKTIPDKNTNMVLYCRGGMRSIIAADSLKKLGYNNVSSMTGGINAWLEADYPIDE